MAEMVVWRWLLRRGEAHPYFSALMISILMPVRNAAATMATVMESIFAQTWSDWELVVVDDGSCDGTGEMLENFARRDARVRVISTGAEGIAKALQTGCGACRGEWIARMDADDWMHPERLAAQVEFSRKHPELGLISCLVGYGGDGAGYREHVDWLNGVVAAGEVFLRRFVESPVAHPSVMFRRDLLERFGGYDAGDFPEDYELWLRWLDAGVVFGKVPRELVVWNDPPTRLSRNDPRYAVERFYELKCRYLARWLGVNVPVERRLWLWGAGRVTRRRFDGLDRLRDFEGFIDVDKKKAGKHRDGRRVVMADSLPDRGEAFVVVGVGNRGARERIVKFLEAGAWVEGRDFILAA